MGYTLIELVVITGTIGVLASIALGTFSDVKQIALASTASTEIREIERLINAYAMDNQGALPANLGVIGKAGATDPWGNGYIYRPHDGINMRKAGGIDLNTDFDLFSAGADGNYVQSILQPTSKDDVIRINDGGWVGTVKNYLF